MFRNVSELCICVSSWIFEPNITVEFYFKSDSSLSQSFINRRRWKMKKFLWNMEKMKLSKYWCIFRSVLVKCKPLLTNSSCSRFTKSSSRFFARSWVKEKECFKTSNANTVLAPSSLLKPAVFTVLVILIVTLFYTSSN